MSGFSGFRWGYTEDPPLFGAKLKASRAREHINNLYMEGNTFSERHPYRVVVENRPDAKMSYLVFHASAEIPSEWAVIIGDAVHNLRSALDYLACDLVRANKKTVEHVYFPIGKDENDFEDIIKNRGINKADQEAIERIRSFTPYGGGNDELRGLHELDIIDKHRLLIPVMGIAAIPTFTTKEKKAHTFPIEGMMIFNPKDGRQVIGVTLPDEIVVDENADVPFGIMFRAGQPFELNSVAPKLYQLADLVDNIISHFTEYFRSL